MATICAVHDLSGVGGCSLTAAISVLSAMGHRCCPMPTAVLSQQTGFPGYSWQDFTPQLPEFIASWDRLGLEPDLIYTGFLGSEAQPALLAGYIGRHPEATVLVDPVMGDNGKLYPCFQMDYVRSMGALVAGAHVITPNVTELWLLAGEDPAGVREPGDGELFALLDRLKAPRLRHAVVTGMPRGREVCTIVADLETRSATRIRHGYSGVSFSGTGDVFASVLCGALAGGRTVEQGARLAAGFVSRIALEMPVDCDPRYGLSFERHLHLLTPYYLDKEGVD